MYYLPGKEFLMIRIGVVGCGAIGTEICRAVDTSIPEMELYAIYDRHAKSLERARFLMVNSSPAVMEIGDMVHAVDLVVECASQEAAREVVPVALNAKCDVLVASVGAFADSGLLESALKTAEKNGCRIFLPSGAICGLDGLKAASIAGIESVSITTEKPPRGLAGAPYVLEHDIDLETIDERTVIFEGNASEAVAAFPANVNVAATLSIAGMGFGKTRVRIVANPAIERNIHEITVKGNFGNFTTRVENVPSPANPRTSYLAALSLIATLKKIAGPLQTGT
jgi:aspartate dehydrogenase